MSAGAWFWEYVGQTWWFWVALLPLAFAIWIGVTEVKDRYSDPFDVVMYSMGGVFVGVVIWLVGTPIFNLVLPHHDQTSRHELVVLHDRASLSGQFVLGSGNVDGVPAFSFYTQDNGFSQFKVLKAPNGRVYQDLKPGETPWMVTFDNCKLWGAIATCFNNGTTITEIHVPPDTIKPTLELDAK